MHLWRRREKKEGKEMHGEKEGPRGQWKV